MCSQKLYGKQPDRPEPYHCKALSERRLRQPDALQSNGSYYREGRSLIGYTVGNPSAKILRDTNDFSVWPGGDDSIARAEPWRAGFDHYAGIAITERHRFV